MRTLIISFWCFFFLCPRPVRASLDVSEVYANPLGDEVAGEWIELWNSGTTEVSTQGYSLSDVAGVVKQYALPEKSIPPGETVLITRAQSSISLNNDGEQIVLNRPDGTVSQSSWFVTAEGKSISLVNGDWIEGAPTPGQVINPSLSPPVLPQVSSVPISQNVSVDPFPTGTPWPSSPSPTPFFSNFLPSPLPNTVQNEVSVHIPLEFSEVGACGSPKEWVEIWNPSDQTINLSDWFLQDFSGVRHALSGFLIQPQSFLALEWKNGWLSNSGDQLSLFWKEQVMDTVVLPACLVGESYALVQGEWIRAKLPSPGGVNGVASEQEFNKGSFFSATESSTSSTSKKVFLEVDIKEQGPVSAKKELKDIPLVLESLVPDIGTQSASLYSLSSSSPSAQIGKIGAGQLQSLRLGTQKVVWGLAVSAFFISLSGLLFCWSKKHMVQQWLLSPEKLVNSWPKM